MENMDAIYINATNRSMHTVRWLYKIMGGVVHTKRAEPYKDWMPLNKAKIEYIDDDHVIVSFDGDSFDLVMLS
jgi:hypothetical protein